MQLAERKRAAAARRKEAATDPEVRRLEAAITARLRPVTADEEEVAALAANETRYLGLALENYRRCSLKPKLFTAMHFAGFLKVSCGNGGGKGARCWLLVGWATGASCRRLQDSVN